MVPDHHTRRALHAASGIESRPRLPRSQSHILCSRITPAYPAGAALPGCRLVRDLALAAHPEAVEVRLVEGEDLDPAHGARQDTRECMSVSSFPVDDRVRGFPGAGDDTLQRRGLSASVCMALSCDSRRTSHRPNPSIFPGCFSSFSAPSFRHHYDLSCSLDNVGSWSIFNKATKTYSTNLAPRMHVSGATHFA